MNLINILKKDENARKVFGKREIKIIEKQLLGINLTQSEKNRLSRDIRKKLEFIQNISVFSDEFKLKKGMEIKKIIEESKENILEDPLFNRIKKIIVFGSAVKNELTFRSDVDIAVEFDEINTEEAFEFRKRQAREKVDVQVYNALPDKIRKSIDEEGRTVWIKKQ